MVTFLTILLIIDIFVLMILIIGLQQGSEGGMGSAFGSGNSTGFFGASGGVTFIVRATWIAGILFFVLSLSLAWLKTREHYGDVKKLLNEDIIPEVSITPVSSTLPSPIASPALNATSAPVAPKVPAATATPAAAATAVPATSPSK